MALTNTRAGAVLARAASGSLAQVAHTTSKSAAFRVVAPEGGLSASAVSAQGARAGSWGIMPTPGFLLQTTQGQPPFLMRETLATLPYEGTHFAGVRYPQLWGMEDRVAATRAKAGAGAELGAFCNLQGRATVLTLRDPAKFPVPQVSDASMSVETWYGRRQVTPASYGEALSKMRPTVAVALHDEIGVTAGNNRTKALAERCVSWLEFSVGVVKAIAASGGYVAPAAAGPQAGKKRKQPSSEGAGTEATDAAAAPPAAKTRRLDEAGSKEEGQGSETSGALTVENSDAPRLLAFLPLMPWAPAVREPMVTALVAAVARANSAASGSEAAPTVVGYVLGGAHLGETATERATALTETLQQLAAAEQAHGLASGRLLRLLTGAGTPEDVLAGVSAGIDVFDSDIVGVMTGLGHAMCFKYEADEATLAGWKDSDAAAVPRGASPFSVDLNDPVYAEDAGRLVEGCTCFACAGLQDQLLAHVGTGLPAGGNEGAPRRPVTHPGHHRAYVNHLLRTKELLAHVLLTAHNTAWYAGFFKAVHAAVAAGRWEAYRAWFLATNSPTPVTVSTALAAGGTPQGTAEAVNEIVNPRGAARGFKAARAAGVQVANVVAGVVMEAGAAAAEAGQQQQQ